MRGKYGNTKVSVDGILFDSKKEAGRWQELKLLEAAGEISSLSRQVEYVLIPAQYEAYRNERTGRIKQKCIERKCSYIADFVYTENGKTIAEDTKGFRTKDYIIKRKLMLRMHGIRIREV